MSLTAGKQLLLSSPAGGYQVSRSLRFNASDSAYLSRTPASAGNRKTWTWAGWVKRSKLSSNMPIFGTDYLGASYCTVYFDSNNTLFFENYSGGYQARLQTTQVFRDPSAWLHIVVALDTTQATAANRAKIYVNGSEVTALTIATYPSQNTDLLINNNQYHEISQSNSTYTFGGYLADIHFIDGQALTPSSFTEVSATTGQLVPKAYSGSYGTNGFKLTFADNSAATAAALGKDTSGNGNNWTPNNFSVTGLVDHTPAGLSYRDSSTASRNWDQSSASSTTSAAISPDRIYWVDLGSSKSFNRITFSVVASGQSADTSTNFITYFSTSSASTGSTICGGGCTVTSASRPSSTTPGTITVTFAGFASQTGRYIGITNGSGAQGGTYTYSNFKVYDDQGKDLDVLVDTPTSISATDTGIGGEIRGNYATLNPLNPTTATLSNGNLDCVTNNAHTHARSTIGMSSGKWYWEIVGTTNGNNGLYGIVTQDASFSNYVGQNASGWGYYADGQKYTNNTNTNYGASFTNNDVIGVAFDADNGTLTFYKNGTSQGQAFSGLTSGPYFAAVSDGGSTTSVTLSANFGQRTFAYTAPSGFKALCDTNLPAPVVAKPSEVMDVKLYTGNGSTQTISGLGFSPDLVWLKARSIAYSHQLYDPIRGTTNALVSNTTAAEAVYSGGLTAFNSNGFSIGNDGGINNNNDTFAAWAWDAGSSTVTNTQGSITSSVRANASAGFSIVTWTASANKSSIGHGLGVAPSFIFCKSRTDGSLGWVTYHRSQGKDKFLVLSGTGAENTLTDYWGSSAPNSTTFSVYDSGYANNAGNMVAYVFSPVAGYSSFGSYTGNGSSDGPFVYTGFRPRWIMIKRTDAAYGWYMYDTARDTYNIAGKELLANASDAEVSDSDLDILSNGFKPRRSSLAFNASGGTFVYAAFAENPFQYARAR